MSFSGINSVKKSASIFVDKEKRGISDCTESAVVFKNVLYVPSLSYTSNKQVVYLNSSKTINVSQTLTSPTSNYVNLNFVFINVDSSNSSSQLATLPEGNQVSLNIENNLSYTYTKNISDKKSVATSLINVLSTNTEHSITVNLDGESLPEIETRYQNYEVANDIELSEDEVWS